MADPFARPIPTIDEQIEILRGLNAEADLMLTSVRKQQDELERHELNLIAAVDGRQRRIDLLLDERLRAATADGLVTA